MMKLKTALNRCVKRSNSLLTPQARILNNGKEASVHASTSGEKTKVLASLIRHGLVAPALLATSLNAQADCRLEFVATIDNQPALTAINTTITRNGQYVYKDNRHSFNTTIACGSLHVEIKRGNLIRIRDITTTDGSTTLVDVEMAE